MHEECRFSNEQFTSRDKFISRINMYSSTCNYVFLRKGRNYTRITDTFSNGTAVATSAIARIWTRLASLQAVFVQEPWYRRHNFGQFLPSLLFPRARAPRPDNGVIVEARIVAVCVSKRANTVDILTKSDLRSRRVYSSGAQNKTGSDTL